MDRGLAARSWADFRAHWRTVLAFHLVVQLLGVALFMLCYTGLAVSLFPYIIPPDITIWQAAAAPKSQLFMLYGAIPLLPIILAYSAYSYYVFWDTTEHDAYH